MKYERHQIGLTVYHTDFTTACITECQIKEVLDDNYYKLTTVKDGQTIDYINQGYLNDQIIFYHTWIFPNKQDCIDCAINHLNNHKLNTVKEIQKQAKKLLAIQNNIHSYQSTADRIDASIIKLITLKQL